MAKADLEIAYVKALDRDPLSRNELAELAQLGASDLMEMGSVAEAAFVREWVRHESYRLRAQDICYGAQEKWGDGKATRTYPFYKSD